MNQDKKDKKEAEGLADRLPTAMQAVDAGGATVDDQAVVTANPWAGLRRFTDARIALGRAGVSLPTQPQLAFQLAHAQARDAVHLALDAPTVLDALRTSLRHEAILLHSAAPDRQTYLQRPDLGRRLDAPSREALLSRGSADHPADDAAKESVDRPAHHPANHPAIELANESAKRRFDVAFVVADGLSPLAIGLHAAPFLQSIFPALKSVGWRIAPVTLVEQGRVALADEVGELLGARLVVMLIGERPGLSSPDSMGAYMTWMPHVGLTDAHRNCISNIRQAGLSYAEAGRKLRWLMTQARLRQISGVSLKEG